MGCRVTLAGSGFLGVNVTERGAWCGANRKQPVSSLQSGGAQGPGKPITDTGMNQTQAHRLLLFAGLKNVKLGEGENLSTVGIYTGKGDWPASFQGSWFPCWAPLFLLSGL